jgi:hypothetical protein
MRFRGPGLVPGLIMAAILTAEDVVRRIAADCVPVPMSTSPGLWQTIRPSRDLPRTVSLVAESGPSAGHKAITKMGGVAVTRPRAADDFATIRARMEKPRRRVARFDGQGTGPGGVLFASCPDLICLIPLRSRDER